MRKLGRGKEEKKERNFFLCPFSRPNFRALALAISFPRLDELRTARNLICRCVDRKTVRKFF